MTADELRALQAPIKAKYKEDASSAQLTIRVGATLDIPRLACRVDSPRGPIDAGLHPAAGGDGSLACSGDMLLEALVGCAGVTLAAVSTAMNIPIRSARITAEGDLDFRGTLGVSRETPVGFTAIRVQFEIDSEAPADQIDKLIQLTERYCVVFQTLKTPPQVSALRTTSDTH